jgi:cyclic beta-1,2-glucan synthetase
MTPLTLTDFAQKLAAVPVWDPLDPGHAPGGYALGDRLAECDRMLRAFVDAQCRTRDDAQCRTRDDAQCRTRDEDPAASGTTVSSTVAAWVLDNYPDLHGALRDIKHAVSPAYYHQLPRIEAAESKAGPAETVRLDRAGRELVSFVSGELDGEMVAAYFSAWQQVSPLTMAELWAAIHFVRLALIESVAQEVVREGPRESVVRAAIVSLRGMERLNWKEMVENLSRVERILRTDPSGDFPRMDFDSRDQYRHVIEKCGLKCRAKNENPALAEERAARTAIELSREETDLKRRHVGYWLIDKGCERWQKECGYRHQGTGLRRLLLRRPALGYLALTALFSAVIVAGSAGILAPVPLWCLLLLVAPAVHVALAMLNPLIAFILQPRRVPRYDFSKGVPDEYKTFVAVPALLLSRENVESLCENLEIHYLANRDPNILFALLTDFKDSGKPEGDNDFLIDLCVEGIEKLNRRYASGNHSPFYLFHRNRRWNESEGRWMGWERKRGKLSDFNRYLLGHDDSAFAVRVGDPDGARGVKYVLTLDCDTQLPRDTAWKLIGAMAHPLNRAVVDPATKVVREGYGLLQPRVSISVRASVRSRLARIYSGQVGYDPYATTVSDLYQDLFGRASFVGKGIYDVAVFEAAAGERFPENTLLSHDLIEGEHVRVGLVTDQEVIDDFPARYEAFSRRKHRWVRGDWQILRWLLPTVPAPNDRLAPNPLRLISRWKIFDNLRRSLMEISLLTLFVAAWTVLPGSPLAWSIVGLALFVLPVWFDLIVAAVRIQSSSHLHSYAREVGYRFARGHLDALLTLIFLPHQAMLMADAIVRTLFRQFISRKHLLEWESMAQTESVTTGSHLSPSNIYLLASPVLALMLMFLIPASESWSNLAFALMEMWLFAPVVALWLDARPSTPDTLTKTDVAFLRTTALRTWRFFADHVSERNNWLVPDNVQENPPLEAHKTSPTNIGLQLNAYASALDFGHTTAEEFAVMTTRTLDSLAKLPRYRGHFLNWYNTEELSVLDPQYVSSVDSGNLAASLLLTRQTCLGIPERPMLSPDDLKGLRDHCELLLEEIPPESRSPRLVRTLDSLARQFGSEPTDLFFWEGLLTECLASARALAELAPGYWTEQLVARTKALLDQLCHFAPWLCESLEGEFRFCFSRPALGPLLELLRTSVSWSALPEHYDRIEAAISQCLASGQPMNALTRHALETLRDRLPAARERIANLLKQWRSAEETVGRWVDEMDFAFLFDEDRMLLRVGCSIDGRPDDSCYDLLASEARTAVLLGIAKGELPREAWFHLGRKITQWRGQRCLVSWSGTMFEYLMPNLFMRTWEGTLLHESCRAIVKIQKLHAGDRNIPWGISESACNSRDSALNYQYHAFGVPVVAARRDFSDRIVVSPYATMLALMVDPASAMTNARLMAGKGWRGRYGFYESIDFTGPGRFTEKGDPQVVQSYMAHHQGMALLAINAAVLKAPMHTRFHADPLVQAAEYLLQERVPNLTGDDIEEAIEVPVTLRPRPVLRSEEPIAEQLQKA